MLTEQETAEFCMIMRVITFMQTNTAPFTDDPEISETLAELKDCATEILAHLDEDEKNALLERYRAELALINNESGSAQE